jgi:hypothetical protein
MERGDSVGATTVTVGRSDTHTLVPGAPISRRRHNSRQRADFSCPSPVTLVSQPSNSRAQQPTPQLRGPAVGEAPPVLRLHERLGRERVTSSGLTGHQEHLGPTNGS